jgi:hypothetical protein
MTSESLYEPRTLGIKNQTIKRETDMKRLLPFVILALTGAGCTAHTLQVYTLEQLYSVPDTRYQEVLDNVAVVAANPGSLPTGQPLFPTPGPSTSKPCGSG